MHTYETPTHVFSYTGGAQGTLNIQSLDESRLVFTLTVEEAVLWYMANGLGLTRVQHMETACTRFTLVRDTILMLQSLLSREQGVSSAMVMKPDILKGFVRHVTNLQAEYLWETLCRTARGYEDSEKKNISEIPLMIAQAALAAQKAGKFNQSDDMADDDLKIHAVLAVASMYGILKQDKSLRLCGMSFSADGDAMRLVDGFSDLLLSVEGNQRYIAKWILPLWRQASEKQADIKPQQSVRVAMDALSVIMNFSNSSEES